MQARNHRGRRGRGARAWLYRATTTQQGKRERRPHIAIPLEALRPRTTRRPTLTCLFEISAIAVHNGCSARPATRQRLPSNASTRLGRDNLFFFFARGQGGGFIYDKEKFPRSSLAVGSRSRGRIAFPIRVGINTGNRGRGIIFIFLLPVQLAKLHRRGAINPAQGLSLV